MNELTPQRPWIKVVWERSFVTEDEADEAYEQYMEWLDEHPVFEVDRFDAHTVRLYLNTQVLEGRAEVIEAAYTPPTITSFCKCGHVAASHKGEDSSCSVTACECRAFELQERK